MYTIIVCKRGFHAAEDELIEAARLRAHRHNTTLNAEFRRWLEHYAAGREEGEERVRRFRELLARTNGLWSGGRKFSRDEMNER